MRHIRVVLSIVLFMGVAWVLLPQLDEGGAPSGTVAVAFAEEGGDADVDSGAGAGGSKWETWLAAGPVGLIILLLSVAGLALIIENFVNMRRDRMIPPHLLQELEELFQQEEYEQAIELCDAEDCFLTRVVGAGLAKVGAGYERMVEAVQEVGEEESTALHQKISYLSLIATVAPMLGLFGTVWGMIDAFNTIKVMGSPSPADLAKGISKALVTTFLGLVVAIPVMTCYNILRNRVVRVVLEVGAVTSELLEKFRPVQ